MWHFFQRYTTCLISLLYILYKHTILLVRCDILWGDRTSYGVLESTPRYHTLFQIGLNILPQQQIIYDGCHCKRDMKNTIALLSLHLTSVICTPQKRHGPSFTNGFSISINWYTIEISFHSHLDSDTVIATKFCTWHDSCVVVACEKLRCYLMADDGVTATRMD